MAEEQTTDQHEVDVRIEGDAPLTVGRRAVVEMRLCAIDRLTWALSNANDLWDDGGIDLDDIAALSDLYYKLLAAKDAANALVCLAPLPDDDQKGNDG